MQTRERSGLALAFIGVLAFSFSLPFTVWALESFDPVLTATGRAVIAAVVAAGILMWRRVPWPDRALIKPLLYTMAGADSDGRRARGVVVNRADEYQSGSGQACR